MTEQDKAASPGATQGSTPLLEWVAAGLGLATVLGLFGTIGWQAFEDADGAPAIVVEMGVIQPVSGGYRVQVSARNEAASAAAEVVIEVSLAINARFETGRMTFDYIAGRSKRTGWLMFGEDPRSGTLTVRALGYAQP